jgi:hypothetical protein
MGLNRFLLNATAAATALTGCIKTHNLTDDGAELLPVCEAAEMATSAGGPPDEIEGQNDSSDANVCGDLIDELYAEMNQASRLSRRTDEGLCPILEDVFAKVVNVLPDVNNCSAVCAHEDGATNYACGLECAEQATTTCVEGEDHCSTSFGDYELFYGCSPHVDNSTACYFGVDLGGKPLVFFSADVLGVLGNANDPDDEGAPLFFGIYAPGCLVDTQGLESKFPKREVNKL